MIHLDTTFLVDLLRETSRKRPGPATAFLEREEAEPLAASVFVVCELLAGAEHTANPAAERDRVQQLLQGLDIVYPDETLAPLYARLLASMKKAGRTTSTMDLLIAATAVAAEAPLLTRNVKHFQHMPTLDLRSY